MARSPQGKHTFLGRLMGRLHRLDPEGLQTVFNRLDRERALLETLFNLIADGLLVVDDAGKIFYLNLAARRILGAPAEGAEGMPVTRLIPGIPWSRLSNFEGRPSGMVLQEEHEISYPTRRFLRLHAASLDSESGGGKGAGVALIVHDATETRRATVEAVESEKVHALTLLAASVAHEIGNPLNALHLHLQLMERDLKRLRRDAANPSDVLGRVDKLEAYLGVASGEIARLDYIVTEFLQAMRPSPPKLTPASLNDVVLETLSILRPELANKRISLEEQLATSVPRQHMDPAQIKQALLNLLKNAIQAMTRGDQLKIATGSGDEGVWVSVSDTGAGIPKEQLERIFEPFFTTKQKGTGLGLMIVNRIIRDHGGRIEVQSELGKGSTFTVRLPDRHRGPKLLTAPKPD
jgi:two-component system, sporulation sensor kinase E